MLDWENLHYFSVFAEEKSLSAAARKLGVDHATVARRIGLLEVSLNLKLVDRRPRTYILTEDGKRIAQVAARMMEETFSIERLVRAGQQDISGEISLSLPPSTAAHLIMPRLGELRTQYPKLRLKVWGETRFASLQHSEADIVVRLERPDEENLVARKVGVMPFGIYAAPDYLANTKPEDYAVIVLDVGRDAQATNQRWLGELLGAREAALVTNTPDLQWGAVCAGIGVAVLPDFMGQKGGLVRLPVDQLKMEREIWLITHEDLRHSPAVRVVMDFLIDCFSSQI